MAKKLNLESSRFGRLLVINEADKYVMPSGYKARKWNCICDCGEQREVFQNALTTGRTQSCGCLHRVSIPAHREGAQFLRVNCDRSDNRYNVWSMMIQRCYEKNHDNFVLYGAIGKTVCDSWIEPYGKGFSNFCEDMGERPVGMTLDRIDNTLGYFPENCRWADQTTQTINRGTNKNNTSGCKGVTWNTKLSKWCAQLAYEYKNIYLGLYEDWFEAVCARKSAEVKYFKVHLE